MALQRHRNVLTVAAGHRHPPSYHGLGAAAVSGRAVACAPVSITVANPRDWQRLSGLSIVGVRIRAMLFGSVRTRTAAGSSGHRLTLYTQVRVLPWWPVSAEQGRAEQLLCQPGCTPGTGSGTACDQGDAKTGVKELGAGRVSGRSRMKCVPPFKLQQPD
jgi:hypothetical protein